MNFRNIAVRGIKEFSDEFPNYSLGEIFYSIFRHGIDAANIKSLRQMTDEEIYTMIDKAKEVEAE